ncbi:DNA topoisomerase III [Bacillus sp. AR18-7]|uniref:DNA topoisomerase III n=1 Tax=Bacillus sp. AR18-7 TaxID=2217821 RepID=UPI0011C8858B|nr:DNA topoisomerase III [Bacillus sp. AR18-7]TXR68272.1 DNA topoisomerase III [Bacillus sp. AR18-7]
MALNERFVMLAEKPDAAKMMAKPFPHEIKNGYIEVKPNPLAKKGGIITYAFGHLVRIPDPEFLDEKYKKWSLDTLPILPTSMPLVPIKGKERQLQIIKTLVNNSDIKLPLNSLFYLIQELRISKFCLC